jgi:hypothetical protein
MPIRRASLAPSETIVAPVSTRKRTVVPLMLPVVTKWPCHQRSMSPGRRRHRRRGDILPNPQNRFLPLASMVASRLSTASTVTPSAVLLPTATVRGAPPSIVSNALPGKTPASPTSTACAPEQRATKQNATAAHGLELQPSHPRAFLSHVESAFRFLHQPGTFGHQNLDGPRHFATFRQPTPALMRPASRSAAINGISAEGWVSQNGEHGMAPHSTPAAVQRAGSCLPARRWSPTYDWRHQRRCTALGGPPLPRGAGISDKPGPGSSSASEPCWFRCRATRQ